MLGEERDFNMDTRTVKERMCARACVYHENCYIYSTQRIHGRSMLKKKIALVCVSVKVTWIRVVQIQTNGMKVQIINQALIIFYTECENT